MANKQFKVPINLVNLASDPGTASEGDVYYNTISDTVKVYANGAWASIGSGGGVSTSLDGVTDVTITSVADNEVLAYDTTSSTWINQTASEAGLATTGTTLSHYGITDAIDTSDNAQTKEGNLTINGDVTADTLDLNKAKITAEGNSIAVNTPVLIDTFDGTIYRSAEYLLQLSQAGSYTTSKILIIHNGSNVSLTEYGTVSIGTEIDYDLSCSFSGNNLELSLYCPEATVDLVTFKYSKTLFDV
jgi:hypothetical protein